MSEVLETLRLDLFLWRTRAFKTRALAGLAIRKKGVRVDRSGQVRRVDKPGTGVAAGDVLIFKRGDHILTWTITALPERRGPAPEAAACYEAAEET